MIKYSPERRSGNEAKARSIDDLARVIGEMDSYAADCQVLLDRMFDGLNKIAQLPDDAYEKQVAYEEKWYQLWEDFHLLYSGEQTEPYERSPCVLTLGVEAVNIYRILPEDLWPIVAARYQLPADPWELNPLPWSTLLRRCFDADAYGHLQERAKRMGLIQYENERRPRKKEGAK